MKALLLQILFSIALSDDLYWMDYNTGNEYSWDFLQNDEEYLIETPTDYIRFNLGTDISPTCQGQSAAVIRFSKAGDFCEILGRHELMFFSPFQNSDTSGLLIFYEGGAICRNKAWDSLKRRVEFKLTCSPIESDFALANKLQDCTTIFEKFSSAGCEREFEYSLSMRILFIL